jgi:hypothetical protein
MRVSLADMFRRHRSDPDPTIAATLRSRLDSIALTTRADAPAFDPRLVRGRLAGSASAGLRDRLGRPALSSSRG